MSPEQSSDSNKLQLSFRQKLSILLSFSKDKVVEQIQCVWFVLAYMILFQLLILGLPIVYATMIGVGISIVIIGLAFFMEGLRLGLMPLGEVLGSVAPQKSFRHTVSAHEIGIWDYSRSVCYFCRTRHSGSPASGCRSQARSGTSPLHFAQPILPILGCIRGYWRWHRRDARRSSFLQKLVSKAVYLRRRADSFGQHSLFPIRTKRDPQPRARSCLGLWGSHNRTGDRSLGFGFGNRRLQNRVYRRLE